MCCIYLALHQDKYEYLDELYVIFHQFARQFGNPLATLHVVNI